MHRRWRSGLLLCAATVMLTACQSSWLESFSDSFSSLTASSSTDSVPDSSEHAMVANPDPIALRLAESADKASTALQDLARVETTRRPPAPEPANIAGPSELHTPVSIDWVGGAEPLIRSIAARLKYDVITTGTVPVVPVVVQVHQRNREVLEALRNIGDQTSAYMDLVVDPQSRRIEIRYLRPEPTQS